MRALFSCLSLSLLILSVSAQDLDDILDAHFKAAQQEKMQKIETIITAGKNVYSTVGFESTFIMYQSRPDKIRIQGEIQGSKMIQIYNGTEGWMFAPGLGIAEPKAIRDQELEVLINQSEFENALWKYRELSSSIEFLGSTDEGSSYHLSVTKKEGDMHHFFIDKESYLISSIKSLRMVLTLFCAYCSAIPGLIFLKSFIFKETGDLEISKIKRLRLLCASVSLSRKIS